MHMCTLLALQCMVEVSSWRVTELLQLRRIEDAVSLPLIVLLEV